MKKHCLLIAVGFFVGASVLGFAATGEIAANTYDNKFVGLRFPVPAGWHVGTDAQVMQGMKEGAQLVGLDGPRARATIKQMPGKVMLMVSKEPLDSDFSGVNRNMIVAAIDVRGHGDEIGSGADYLRLIAGDLRKQLTDAAVSDITTETLGGEEFHKLDVRLPIQGIPAYVSQMARIANDYLLVLNLTAESSSGLHELSGLASTLAFSAVPQEVDGGAEGQSFRRQASFALSGSSRNPLKNIGNILMVGGAILMVGGAIWRLMSIFRGKRSQ